MSFKNYCFTRDKQHINLSSKALSVMESDMFNFKVTSRSAFLNHIFKNYYEYADASISIRLEEEKEALIGHLEKHLPKDYLEKAVEVLLENKLTELQKTVKSYPKGEGFKFRVRNNNYEYLESDGCKEDKYYSRLGTYYKAIIEEYADKPYLEREKIFFKEIINNVELAIKSGKQIKITLNSGGVFCISPYGIFTDSMETYHYLTGYNVLVNEDGERTRSTISFRLSNIFKLNIEHNKNSIFRSENNINETAKKQIDDEIKKRGIQFMYSEAVEVHIRLTSSGIKRYQNGHYLRPMYTEILNDNIYVFHCTPTQIEFYFYKFGKDATIMKPLYLAEKMKNMYKEAYETYRIE